MFREASGERLHRVHESWDWIFIFGEPRGLDRQESAVADRGHSQEPLPFGTAEVVIHFFRGGGDENAVLIGVGGGREQGGVDFPDFDFEIEVCLRQGMLSSYNTTE